MYLLTSLQVERGIINLAGAKVRYTEDKQKSAAVSNSNNYDNSLLCVLHM